MVLCEGLIFVDSFSDHWLLVRLCVVFVFGIGDELCGVCVV